jgi:hypothetical protein
MLKQKIKIIFPVILFFGLFCFAQNSEAADQYVRPGGSGSGASWAEARNSINWGSVSPGDTIWLAGGSYGTLSIGASGNASSRIYIKRATASAHGTGTGWSASFDSQAVIETVNGGGRDYWTLDGSVPYEGIKITNVPNSPSTPDSHAINLGSDHANYVELKNLDVTGPNDRDYPAVSTGEKRCLNFYFGSRSRGLYVGYSQFHQADTLLSTIGMEDMIFEHNKLFDNYTTDDYHANVWQTANTNNVIFRYNEVYNWAGEGIMMNFVGGMAANTNWYIYGNVWHDAVLSIYPRVLESQYVTNGPIYLFNNTFVSLWQPILTSNGGSWSSGSQGRNNIYWDLQGRGMAFSGDNGSSTIVGEGTGNTPFQNYSGQDYRLSSSSSARNAGAALSAINGINFNTDMAGNVRGADGTWDIGAYEYGGTGGSTTCTSFTYSAWGACQNNFQARTITSRTPSGCIGGNPESLSQACSTTCTPNWSCGSWGTCSNSQQTRTCTDSNSCGTTAGQPAVTQSCTTPIPPKTYTLADFTNLVVDWLKSITGSPADVNLDNKINSKDLGIIMSNWATGSGGGTPTSCGDGTCNGTETCSTCSGDCGVCPAPGSWQNHAITNQTGSFSAEFDARPTQANSDAVIGLSNGAADAYTDLAAIVRFSDANQIDAINGGSYASSSSLTYNSNTTYHFKLTASLASRTYDAYVTPQGGQQTQIAQGYAFRSDQSAVSNLNNWASFAETGGVTVSNFTLGAGSPAPAPTPTCTPNWSCGSWGTCSNGQQTRTCTDSNNCGVTTGRPAITQSCTTPTPTPTPTPNSGTIIINHNAVDLYDNIPTQYMNTVKTMWFNMPGESHSRAYYNGLLALQNLNSNYNVTVSTDPGSGNISGSGLAINYDGVFGSLWNGSYWDAGAGEEDWFYGGATMPQGHIQHVSNASYRPSVLGLGWCWDAYLTPSDFDNYVSATQGYSTYAKSLGSRVRVVFTTGPVDSPGNGSAARDAKYQRVRNFVASSTNEILFDYADILEYNDAGQKSSTTYEEIHPSNYVETNSHIGSAGELRLAKAAWVLMARVAGWNGQ